MAFDPAKVKVVSTVKHAGAFFGLCREPDGDRLFAGSDDFGVHVIDLASKKAEPVARWAKHESWVLALAAAKVGGKTVVVSGGGDRRLVWWDSATGEPIRTIEDAHDGWVRDLLVTPDGTRLVSTGDDMLLKVWDLSSGKVIHTFDGHAKQTPQGHVTTIYSLAVSPDGKFLASGDRHGEVYIRETDSGKTVAEFEVPTLYTYDPRQRKRSMGGVRSLAFSPDGNTLAAGGIGQIGNVDGLGGPIHIELWDWRKPQLRVAAGAKGQKGMVNQLVFHPDGEWLIGAGGGGSGFLAFWQVRPLPDVSADPKAVLPEHYTKFDGHAHRLILDPKKAEIYAAGFRKLDVWSLGG